MLSDDVRVIHGERTAPALFLGRVLSIVEERGKHYGPPDEHWRATAQLWTTLLEAKGLSQPLTEQDVAMLFVADKLVRQFTGPRKTEDGWLDIAGYACGAAVVGE